VGTEEGRGMTRAMAYLMAAGLALLLQPLVASGGERARAHIDDSEIYYGDSGNFESPAMVDVDQVYRSIPEYKEIIDRDLKESDPRYHYLMRAATDRFLSALSAAAADGGYDLIGGLGSIRIEGKKVPVITALVVKKLAG
jgi:hypothetical protein